MRNRVVVLAPLLALAACGSSGGGVAESAGTIAPPISTVTPPSSPTSTKANMLDASATTTFDAVGALQSLSVDDKGAELYRGDASTVDAPSGTISYNPRDGIFTLALSDAAAGVTRNITFQDPAHRATADSARNGEYEVPLLAGFNYLQALDGDANLTFFYKRPTNGSFVSLGGFERATLDTKTGAYEAEQGVFVFGDRTPGLAMPLTGAGHFDGEFLATMVGQEGNTAGVLQWISGTSAVDADFAKRTLSLSVDGTVGPGYVKDTQIADANLAIAPGTAFSAQGSASWTSTSTAFSGKFSSAGFVTSTNQAIPVDFTPVSAGTTTAGASSIDGTFYGPATQNVGGNFRIVGGVPNERFDILGAFTAAKK